MARKVTPSPREQMRKSDFLRSFGNFREVQRSGRRAIPPTIASAVRPPLVARRSHVEGLQFSHAALGLLEQVQSFDRFTALRSDCFDQHDLSH